MGMTTLSISALSVALSSIPAEILIIPLCTIRLNMMISGSSPMEVAFLIYEQRGISGFFIASFYGILSQMLSSTIKFFIYQKLKKVTGSTQKRWILNSVLGAISGILGSFLLSPIDRMKVLKQAGQISLTTVLREPWKGFSGTIAKNVILYGSLFSMTDIINSYVKDPLLMSLLLSIFINILLQPIEVFRSKVMTSSQNTSGGHYQGYLFSVIISFVTNFVINTINPFVLRFLKKKIDYNDTKLTLSVNLKSN